MLNKNESVVSGCVSGLKPSTRYEFSVFGRNKLGLGHHSITITSQTWGEAAVGFCVRGWKREGEVTNDDT